MDRQVCLKDYLEDCSLVLFFSHAKDCPECRGMLASFAERKSAYSESGTKVLAVFPETVEELRGDQSLTGLPFPVLSDAEGRVRKSYSSLMDSSLVRPEDSMVFVLDMYNSPYAASVGADLPVAAPAGLPDTGMVTDETDQFHHDVLKWVEYISIQCPE